MDTNTKIKNEHFTALPTETTAIASPTAAVHMKFHEAIDLIEGRHAAHPHIHHAKHAVERHIADTGDTEEKAVGYYYLLRLLLSERIFHENSHAKKLYKAMLDDFYGAEAGYRSDYKMASAAPERLLIYKQTEAFYQLADGYLKTLETLYDKKGFAIAKDRVHADKMRFRRRAAHFSGRYAVHLGHLFLEHSSNYGHSFMRWGVTVFLFIFLFAGIFAGIDYVADWRAFHGLVYTNPFDYLYFSMASFTTVGYGDIVPLTDTGKILASSESLLGYLMLGIFITLIQKRL